MKGSEQKVKRQLETTQAAAVFRTIADVLEGNASPNPDDIAGLFEDFNKASLKLKRKGANITFKIKVESALAISPQAADGLASETESPGKSKYKSLKKRMKSTFGSIRDSIREDRMPDPGVVKSFLEDSELMVGFPGYGDEYYGEYTKACRQFSEAYNGKNRTGLKTAYETLRQMKSDCHDRYK